MVLNKKNPLNPILFFLTVTILLIIALAFAADAQKPGRLFTKCNPTGFVNGFDSTKDYLRDSCQIPDKYYFWKKGTWQLTVMSDVPAGLTPIFQTGLVTTLPANTPATGAVRSLGGNNYAIDLGVPQGIQGIPGGSSGSFPGLESPDSYGACHCTSGADKQALITAFRNGNNKSVILYGEYWADNTIWIDPYINVNQLGTAIIHSLNGNFSPVIGRPNPTDINDANKYCLYRAHFSNVQISMPAGSSQVGFDMKAGQNIYDYCSAVGGLWGARSEFQLKAVYDHFSSLSCTNGIYIGIGTFPGATINNAQSNGCLLESPYSHTVSNTAVYIDASYETDIRNMVVEGNGTIQYGLYYNMQNSTTAKNGSLNFFHGEQVGGCTKSWIYVSMSNGTISLDNIICHYPGLVVDAQSSNSTGVTEVGYFNYAVGDANGNYFNSHTTIDANGKKSGMNFMFYLCYSFYPTVVPNRFISPAPDYCSNFAGCTGNTFSLITSR